MLLLPLLRQADETARARAETARARESRDSLAAKQATLHQQLLDEEQSRRQQVATLEARVIELEAALRHAEGSTAAAQKQAHEQTLALQMAVRDAATNARREARAWLEKTYEGRLEPLRDAAVAASDGVVAVSSLSIVGCNRGRYEERLDSERSAAEAKVDEAQRAATEARAQASELFAPPVTPLCTPLAHALRRASCAPS